MRKKLKARLLPERVAERNQVQELPVPKRKRILQRWARQRVVRKNARHHRPYAYSHIYLGPAKSFYHYIEDDNWEKVFLDVEEFDADGHTELSIYYELLSEFSVKYKLPRWQIEKIIIYCFPAVIEDLSLDREQGIVIDLEQILRIKKREVEKAVSRWHTKMDDFLDWVQKKHLFDEDDPQLDLEGELADVKVQKQKGNDWIH